MGCKFVGVGVVGVIVVVFIGESSSSAVAFVSADCFGLCFTGSAGRGLLSLVEVICVGRYGIVGVVVGKSSSSSGDGFCQVFISRMLAARAAKSIRGGGGARERGVSLLVGSWVVVVVVDVVVVVVLSLLRWDDIEGFIARILAARAARSMRGGGGAREIVVFWVVGAEGGVGDGRSVVVGSWSMGCRPFGAAAVFSTWFLVPWCCGGRKKEASGCLLSSSSQWMS